MLLEPDEVIYRRGPWEHRDVSANGSRFHVVEAGEGPLIVLLHGFPTFWWSWRDHITRLADAGFRVIAMDLRGYAGSDHPPHGYDPTTLANDVAGVIRSLGEGSATIIGHGWGGLIAWSMPVLTPEVVSAIVPVSMPHPRRLRRALLTDPLQRGRSMYAIGFQWPFLPERSLMADDCRRVSELIMEWSGTSGFPDHATSIIYRSAFSLWPTAHCAVEYHRWAFRSFIRSDGLRYARRMEAPITVPVLQVHGADDTSVLPRVAEGSSDWVAGDYELVLLPGAGHFPHEEDPEGFAAILMPWLDRHRDHDA